MVQKNNIEYEIILALISKSNHVRALANYVGTSHVNVMRKLNKLVEENVLDYEIEGKNKVFSIKSNLQAKNYVFNSERYKLVKLINKYPELAIIIEDLLKKSSESMIILFGSYAKFKAKPESDIDIYIETRSKKAKEESESINSKIRAKVGNFNKESPLIKEIINYHIILKGVEEFYEKTGFFK